MMEIKFTIKFEKYWFLQVFHFHKIIGFYRFLKVAQEGLCSEDKN